MTRRLLRSILLCGILAAAGIQNLEASSYEVNVGEFNRLKVCDSINVTYIRTPQDDCSGVVRFEASEPITDAFIFTNKNGELKIQVATDYASRTDLPALTINSVFLTSAVNEGKGNVAIKDVAPCSEFKMKVIGNGKITAHGIQSTTCSITLETGCATLVAEGTARTAKIKLVGTGTIQADKLAANTVDCSIMGSGSIGCRPLENLNVKGVGSTKIYYSGSPEIKKRGGGTLIPLDE